jgi:hypothetical protein
MSFSRFDGFFALSHSMFVGLAWILYPRWPHAVPRCQIAPFLDNASVSELQARVYFVLLRLLDWVDAALSRSASADNYVFIFEICFLLWWLTYLGVWSIFRYGYTWRAIVPAGVVLLINTYYAPNSTVGFLAAFVLIASDACWCAQIYPNSSSAGANSASISTPTSCGISCVTASSLARCWCWSPGFLPGLGRNPQVREVLTPLTSTWEETAEGMYSGSIRG